MTQIFGFRLYPPHKQTKEKTTLPPSFFTAQWSERTIPRKSINLPYAKRYKKKRYFMGNNILFNVNCRSSNICSCSYKVDEEYLPEAKPRANDHLTCKAKPSKGKMPCPRPRVQRVQAMPFFIESPKSIELLEGSKSCILIPNVL